MESARTVRLHGHEPVEFDTRITALPMDDGVMQLVFLSLASAQIITRRFCNKMGDSDCPLNPQRAKAKRWSNSRLTSPRLRMQAPSLIGPYSSDPGLWNHLPSAC